MKTKRISISIFQILIFIIVIIAIVVAVIVFKDKIGKDTVTPIESKFLGTGTKEDAYQISKIEDLITFFINLNQGESYKDQYFILNTSLDFQDDNSYSNPQDTSFGDLNNDGQIDGIKQELTTGKVFIKAQKNNNKKEKDDKEIVFEGNFNGNGKTINNLLIDVPEDQVEDSIGLFRNNFGTIQDLKVVAQIFIPNVEGKTASIGIIAGKNSGTLQKCKVEGEIVANTESTNNTIIVAGIVGENTGTILDSSSDVDITANHLKAGIVAKNVNSSDNENSGVITNCTNNGYIKELEHTEQYTAGIVAINEKGKITNCTNNGKLEGKLVGGIVGTSTGEIIACSNTGDISNLKTESDDTEIAGGIVGILDNTTIENCKNTGKVKGLTYIAGIAAQNKGSISLSRNDGELSKVSGTKANTIYIGGVSGVNYSNSKIVTSKNYGNIHSTEDTLIMMGGICGNLEADSIIDYCENNGFVNSFGKKIHRNEDMTKKCNSCKTGGGGRAEKSATGGELFIGLIYGNTPGIEEVEILEIEGEE